MGFQYLLLVRVKQCIDLPVHALRPLESQRLGGLLGLFLRRETTGEEPQPRRLFLKILYPSSIPEQTSRYNDTHTYYDRERRHRNPLTRAPGVSRSLPSPASPHLVEFQPVRVEDTFPPSQDVTPSWCLHPNFYKCHTRLVLSSLPSVTPSWSPFPTGVPPPPSHLIKAAHILCPVRSHIYLPSH